MLTIKHSFVSDKPDNEDDTLVRPSDWNADHLVEGTLDATQIPNTEPDDSELTAGQVLLWFDATVESPKLMIKGKDSDGNVVTGSVSLG